MYKYNKSIINIKNNDQYCFVWSILAYLFPANEHKHRVSNYTCFINKLNMQGIEMPMHINQIPKFEKQNGLCINVFELESNTLSPVYINKNYSSQQIDLLLYNNHFCLITNIARLISPNRNLNFVCRRCLNVFNSPEDVKVSH